MNIQLYSAGSYPDLVCFGEMSVSHSIREELSRKPSYRKGKVTFKECAAGWQQKTRTDFPGLLWRATQWKNGLPVAMGGRWDRTVKEMLEQVSKVLG